MKQQTKTAVRINSEGGGMSLVKEGSFTPITDITVPSIFDKRIYTGMENMDKLIGGGFIAGTTFTIAAGPGFGKTTCMMQMMEGMAKSGFKCGYCSGEENTFQLKRTAQRLNVNHPGILLANLTDVDKIAEVIETGEFDIIIVDSFQSITCSRRMNKRALEQYALDTLITKAKETNTVLGFVCHITKMGQQKGSMLVQHAPDALFSIYRIPGQLEDYPGRHFVAHKNRFGPCTNITAYLNPTGFDWEWRPPQEIHTTQILAPKSTRKQEEYAKLLAVEDKITLAEAALLIGDTELRAGWLLRHLVNDGAFKKKGRGKDACFIRTKADDAPAKGSK
jgi:predicted ATP-dependent serine protease